MNVSKILLVILLIFLLSMRFFLYFAESKKYKEGDEVFLTYSFMKEARHNSYGQYFFTSNILVTLPLYPRYKYSDTIKLKGKVTSQINGKESILILNNPSVSLVKNKNPLLKVSAFVRKRIEESVLAVLPEREGGLFLGIILGVRDKIDNNFYQQLRNAGVLHIIAASGQNVSILASILLTSLSPFVKRRSAILFTAVLILFYSMLSAFDPPIVRASIMALLTFGAMILGRQAAGLYTLGITGWSMLFLNPDLLVDISFQLSFLSTLGIITVKPVIDSYINTKKLTVLKEDLTTTLSAQIATLPIMIGSFGSYSLLSLPVNILLLWTIPPLMLDGILSLFISLFSPILAQVMVVIAYPFLLYFTKIVDLSSYFKLSFSFENVPNSVLFGYYLILIAIVIKLKYKKGAKT